MPRYSFSDLLQIMARLRAPNGCPWDREQTHESLLPYLIEEAHEFIDAVEGKDAANMREELGDVLLQVVFHAEVAREAGTFDIDGVIQDISEKLVRRHPHVFGEAKADDADAVVAQWDQIKKAEKGDSSGAHAPATSLLDGIPRSLPPLPKALKISKKAVKAGFEWPDWTGVLAKVREELAEFEVEAKALDRDKLEAELGDILFSVVNLGRVFDIDPERALARTNARFSRRFQAMEKMAAEAGKPFESHSLEEMEALWTEAKKRTADS
ncbi:MAG: MazG family protein [Fibrobacteria bacterium]|jgi:tetrapyrrole methylase family protein/MazG family protein|nr:MazG family protein [Fibrobacteria bacterium]